MERRTQWNVGYWLLALLLLLMVQDWWSAAQKTEAVPYSEFEQALADGRVAEVIVGDRTVTGRLKSPDANGREAIAAVRVEPDLAERLSRYPVPYTRVVESTFVLERCAQALLERETLDETAIRELTANLLPAAPAETATLPAAQG